MSTRFFWRFSAAPSRGSPTGAKETTEARKDSEAPAGAAAAASSNTATRSILVKAIAERSSCTWSRLKTPEGKRKKKQKSSWRGRGEAKGRQGRNAAY